MSVIVRSMTMRKKKEEEETRRLGIRLTGDDLKGWQAIYWKMIDEARAEGSVPPVPAAVDWAIIRAGLKVLRRVVPGKVKRWPKETRVKALELLKTKRILEVSEELGVPKTTLWRWLRIHKRAAQKKAA